MQGVDRCRQGWGEWMYPRKLRQFFNMQMPHHQSKWLFCSELSDFSSTCPVKCKFSTLFFEHSWLSKKDGKITSIFGNGTMFSWLQARGICFLYGSLYSKNQTNWKIKISHAILPLSFRRTGLLLMTQDHVFTGIQLIKCNEKRKCCSLQEMSQNHNGRRGRCLRERNPIFPFWKCLYPTLGNNIFWSKFRCKDRIN